MTQREPHRSFGSYVRTAVSKDRVLRATAGLPVTLGGVVPVSRIIQANAQPRHVTARTVTGGII